MLTAHGPHFEYQGISTQRYYTCWEPLSESCFIPYFLFICFLGSIGTWTQGLRIAKALYHLSPSFSPFIPLFNTASSTLIEPKSESSTLHPTHPSSSAGSSRAVSVCLFSSCLAQGPAFVSVLRKDLLYKSEALSSNPTPTKKKRITSWRPGTGGSHL
jgi:hypothetical protein